MSTWPQVPITTPDFVPGYQDAPTMDTKISARLNALQLAASLGLLGEQSGTTPVTLSTTNAFASTSVVTFTLPMQRRVRITVNAAFFPAAATNAKYQVQAGYNTGTSAVIGSFVGVGQLANVALANTQPATGSAEGTKLLPAGTYTAYAAVTRASDGSATDQASTFYVAVYDVGGA